MSRLWQGDKLIHIPTETKFTLVKPVRQKSTGRLFLSDGETRYPADECKYEMLHWLETALTLVELVLSNPVAIEDYELLSALELEFKGELWQHLTQEQKDGLKALKRQAEETNRAA